MIRWHTNIFRTPLTVVLRVRKRRVNKDHADVGSAVRVLVEHGLRVVIDSSDDSLPSLARDGWHRPPAPGGRGVTG